MKNIFLFFFLIAVAPSLRAQTHTDTVRQWMRHPDDRHVIVSSHRGDWRNAAENSLQAIKNALDMGVDIVEIDVQISKDGRVILMHDETLDRATTGKGRVRDWTLDSLKTLYIRDGLTNPTHQRIPTLEEVLKLARGRALIYLDKAIDKVPELLAVLKKTHSLKEGVFMMPWSYTEARAKFGPYLDSVVYVARIEDTVRDPQAFIKGYLENFHPLAIQLRLPSPASPAVALAGQIRKEGISVCVSTMWDFVCAGHDDDGAFLDPDGNWGWHVRNGVNLFNCDRPALLLKYLHEKGWRR